VELGLPLSDALTEMAASLEHAPLSRAIEQLTVALDRGSPLVDVLRAQAQDSRDDAKRTLLEAAGRKEVAMLVPLERELGCFRERDHEHRPRRHLRANLTRLRRRQEGR